MSAVLNQAAIQPHNAKPAATWSAPGELYDDISRGISGAINHGVDRLQARAGDRVLDLACGTGWASCLPMLVLISPMLIIPLAKVYCFGRSIPTVALPNCATCCRCASASRLRC